MIDQSDPPEALEDDTIDDAEPDEAAIAEDKAAISAARKNRAEKAAKDAEVAMAEYNALSDEVNERTARLRSQRLAKEAAEAAKAAKAKKPAATKAKAPAKPKPRRVRFGT